MAQEARAAPVARGEAAVGGAGRACERCGRRREMRRWRRRQAAPTAGCGGGRHSRTEQSRKVKEKGYDGTYMSVCGREKLNK